jgi:hypothetical protein
MKVAMDQRGRDPYAPELTLFYDTIYAKQQGRGSLLLRSISCTTAGVCPFTNRFY